MTDTRPPLSDEQHAAIRAEITAALSTAGAFCGCCGFEPGETGCADCVRVRDVYADELMPILDRLRAERDQARAQLADAIVAGLTAMHDHPETAERNRSGLRMAMRNIHRFADRTARES